MSRLVLRGAVMAGPFSKIRRLLVKITQQQPPDPEYAWSWSRWRRKRQYQARMAYDASRVIVPAPDHELTTLALQVLLFTAGPDGPWHQGWVSQQTAAHARQTIDRLTETLTASHSHEIE